MQAFRVSLLVVLEGVNLVDVLEEFHLELELLVSFQGVFGD